MAPKQDSHAERINVMESQIGGLTIAFEEMHKTADAREQRAVEAEKQAEERECRAEERPQKVMAAKEKPPDAKPESNPSLAKSGSNIGSSDDMQSSSTEGSNSGGTQVGYSQRGSLFASRASFTQDHGETL